MAHAGKLKEKRGDIRFQRYFVCIFLIELTSKVSFVKRSELYHNNNYYYNLLY